MFSGFHSRRIYFWLVFGFLVLSVAVYLRFREKPVSVPEPVRAAGLLLMHEQLSRLERSDFGQTERGQRLIQQAQELLAQNRIDFSARLNGPRGVTWRPFFWSRDRVFLKVIERPGKRYFHQLPHQLMEALIHESLHASKGGHRRASREEEWDAFVAGLQAEAAMVGGVAPSPLRIDGLSVAEFVARYYPEAGPAPDYQPVAETRNWLERMVRLPEAD
jgi:hypothetical protein